MFEGFHPDCKDWKVMEHHPFQMESSLVLFGINWLPPRRCSNSIFRIFRKQKKKTEIIKHDTEIRKEKTRNRKQKSSLVLPRINWPIPLPPHTCSKFQLHLQILQRVGGRFFRAWMHQHQPASSSRVNMCLHIAAAGWGNSHLPPPIHPSPISHPNPSPSLHTAAAGWGISHHLLSTLLPSPFSHLPPTLPTQIKVQVCTQQQDGEDNSHLPTTLPSPNVCIRGDVPSTHN